MLSMMEKAGTENDEDPFSKISKIMDMRPISIKNMNGLLLRWYQHLLQNIKLLLGKFEIVIISGLYHWVQNNSLFTWYS